MDKPKVLVIDDDEGIRTQMKWALAGGYDVFLAADGDVALDILRKEDPRIITLDLGLPPRPDDTEVGLKLLHDILKLSPSAKVVVVSGNSDKNSAHKAVANGASDYFTKPIDIEELKTILKRANYIDTLEREYRGLKMQGGSAGLRDIVGSSPGISQVFSVIKKVSATDVPVLITGESGTGKELVARAIHSESLRALKPFVPINCGAIPETLMESELFGHEKGSFTGAHQHRPGKIESAEAGTLFLDEIGELPLSLQVKLLRFLQDRKIERIGGRQAKEVDLRVIAATNRDIPGLVRQGLFREDLFFRLAVVTMEVPPLRRRQEDIPLLAKTFLERYSRNGGRKRFGPDAIEAMSRHEWPGNVRELENRVRRALVLSEGPAITADDLGFEHVSTGHSETLDLKEARRTVEIRVISSAIAKHNGNISRAAEELGLTRPTLHHLLKKYSIKYRETD
jgi:two-component system NtrC family response regulator